MEGAWERKGEVSTFGVIDPERYRRRVVWRCSLPWGTGGGGCGEDRGILKSYKKKKASYKSGSGGSFGHHRNESLDNKYHPCACVSELTPSRGTFLIILSSLGKTLGCNQTTFKDPCLVQKCQDCGSVSNILIVSPTLVTASRVKGNDAAFGTWQCCAHAWAYTETRVDNWSFQVIHLLSASQE